MGTGTEQDLSGRAGQALIQGNPPPAGHGQNRFLLFVTASVVWVLGRVLFPLIHIPIEEAVALTNLRRWLTVPELLISELMLVFVAVTSSANALELYRLHERPLTSSLTRGFVIVAGAFSVFVLVVGAVMAAMLISEPETTRMDPPNHLLMWSIGVVIVAAILSTAFTDGLRTRIRSGPVQ